ncbi:hypothetical protein ES703_60327 [subsurface metagenome]
MTFGYLLRKLRRSQGIGIKKLAPALDLDYTYLSRIENDKVIPSEEVIDRVSAYFNYDKDELMLLANKIPEDIRLILRENHQEALHYLRERFAGHEQHR